MSNTEMVTRADHEAAIQRITANFNRDATVWLQERDAAEAKLAKIRTALNDVAQRHDLTILTIYRILNEESLP